MNLLRPAPGSSPASLLHHPAREKNAPKLRVVEYGPDHYEEREVRSVAELPAAPAEGCQLWVEMNGLGDVGELGALGEKYGLHPLTLEDTLSTGQRLKFEPYDQYAFILAQMVYHEEGNTECHHEQVSIFLGKRWLITVQEEADHDVFDPVRARLRAGGGNARRLGPDYMAYALLDSIIDHLFPILEDLGADIEEMEDRLIDAPSRDCAVRIHEYKRTLMKLRRAVWPERDIVNSMLHDDSGLISRQTKVYLRDCYDHTVQIMDLVESYRDVASGLMELYLSAVGMRTNEIMRVLTVISAIFIPLTFVVGLYGMNFDWANGENATNMPELHWKYGYLACLALMAIIAAVQYVIFKRKKWL